MGNHHGSVNLPNNLKQPNIFLNGIKNDVMYESQVKLKRIVQKFKKST